MIKAFMVQVPAGALTAQLVSRGKTSGDVFRPHTFFVSLFIQFVVGIRRRAIWAVFAVFSLVTVK